MDVIMDLVNRVSNNLPFNTEGTNLGSSVCWFFPSDSILITFLVFYFLIVYFSRICDLLPLLYGRISGHVSEISVNSDDSCISDSGVSQEHGFWKSHKYDFRTGAYAIIAAIMFISLVVDPVGATGPVRTQWTSAWPYSETASYSYSSPEAFRENALNIRCENPIASWVDEHIRHGKNFNEFLSLSSTIELQYGRFSSEFRSVLQFIAEYEQRLVTRDEPYLRLATATDNSTMRITNRFGTPCYLANLGLTPGGRCESDDTCNQVYTINMIFPMSGVPACLVLNDGKSEITTRVAKYTSRVSRIKCSEEYIVRDPVPIASSFKIGCQCPDDRNTYEWTDKFCSNCVTKTSRSVAAGCRTQEMVDVRYSYEFSDSADTFHACRVSEVVSDCSIRIEEANGTLVQEIPWDCKDFKDHPYRNQYGRESVIVHSATLGRASSLVNHVIAWRSESPTEIKVFPPGQASDDLTCNSLNFGFYRSIGNTTASMSNCISQMVKHSEMEPLNCDRTQPLSGRLSLGIVSSRELFRVARPLSEITGSVWSATPTTSMSGGLVWMANAVASNVATQLSESTGYYATTKCAAAPTTFVPTFVANREDYSYTVATAFKFCDNTFYGGKEIARGDADFWITRDNSVIEAQEYFGPVRLAYQMKALYGLPDTIIMHYCDLLSACNYPLMQSLYMHYDNNGTFSLWSMVTYANNTRSTPYFIAGNMDKIYMQQEVSIYADSTFVEVSKDGVGGSVPSHHITSRPLSSNSVFVSFSTTLKIAYTNTKACPEIESAVVTGNKIKVVAKNTCSKRGQYHMGFVCKAGTTIPMQAGTLDPGSNPLPEILFTRNSGEDTCEINIRSGEHVPDNPYVFRIGNFIREMPNRDPPVDWTNPRTWVNPLSYLDQLRQLLVNIANRLGFDSSWLHISFNSMFWWLFSIITSTVGIIIMSVNSVSFVVAYIVAPYLPAWTQVNPYITAFLMLCTVLAWIPPLFPLIHIFIMVPATKKKFAFDKKKQ